MKHCIFALLTLIFVPAIFLTPPASLAADAPVFLSVIPGRTTKPEVDLAFGEPLRRVRPDADEYEYAPPSEADIFERIVITFFSDSKQVSRLDAYFKVPHSAESIRTEMQLGKRVLTRDRSEGGQEEFYYPKFNGLIFTSKAPGSPVAAVVYFSPRFLSGIFVSRCNEFLKTKQYPEASDEADKAVLVDPDYTGGYLAQGWYHQSLKNYDEAIVRFLAATSAKYSSHGKGEAYVWLGFMYWNHKNLPEKAQEEFQKGISIAPDYYYTHLHFGRFLRSQKQTDRAMTELTRAVELNSKNGGARWELASLLYEKKDFAKAISHYEWLSQWVESDAAADRDDQTKARIHFEYAYSLSELGKNERAIQIYELALKRMPSSFNTCNNIALQYQALKNFTKAEEYFRRGLSMNSKDFLLNRNLGRLFLEQGRIEEARQQAELSLRLKPDDYWTLIDIAHTWAAQGKKKQALEWIEKSVAAGFRNRNDLATDRYFESLRHNGDFKKLIEGMR